MRALLVALLLLGLLAPATLAENPAFLGEEPPAFGFGPFANAVLPFRGLDEFAGEVVVLEFLRTSCPGCLGVMPALEKTHQAYDRADVHVFCVTNDSAELTQRFLIHESAGRKLTYPITTQCRQSFGVTALPWTYVIGRDGKVAWAGHPGRGYSKQLAVAVGAEDPAMPAAPASLRKAIARIVDEKYAKALVLAAKAAADPETAAFGAYVEGRVLKAHDRMMATVDLQTKRGDLFSACRSLEEMRGLFAATPYAEAIEERLGVLETDVGTEPACKAWKRYHAAWKAARKGKGGIAQAHKQLESLAEGEVASAAQAAQALLEVLSKPWTLDDAATFGGCSN